MECNQTKEKKFMVRSKMELVHSCITIDNKQVQQFTYLENRITENGRSKINIIGKFAQVKRAF